MQRYEELNKSFINGEWTEGLSERTYDILNPYDNSVIATVRLATKEQLNESFEIAKKAQTEWTKTSANERKEVLRKAADYLKANREAIVDVVVRETGGTILKANAEVQSSIDEIEESINMADELY
ncbi:MAG: aldehyde dehydrogenase family protein, partial [Thermoanaerobacterium sp.]|nr:aldehyde dehydrogenase family protein [Thermoanaerobacterium sp.]